jgi:hypothetical protein
MNTTDFIVKSFFGLVLVGMIGGITITLVRECSRTELLQTPRQIIRSDKIGETSDYEIRRISVYEFTSVQYDTIPKR